MDDRSITAADEVDVADVEAGLIVVDHRCRPGWASWWEGPRPQPLPPICQPEGPSEAEVRVEALTASARAKAAAVTLAAVELVDAAAALLAVEDELGTTWRQWFGWQCGLTRTETQQVCSLATRLPELPLIDAAFRSGEISLGVTAELVSVATADNEAALLDTTRSATGAQLGVLLRDYRRARRDARRRLLPEEDPAVAPSTVVAGWAANGRYTGCFDLRPDHGALAEAALEAARNVGRLDEATIDAGGPGANPVMEGDATPAEKRRATAVDAFVDILRTYLAHQADGDGDLPEECQIHLIRHLDGPTAGETLLTGSGALDPAVAEVLACGADRVDHDMVAGFPASAPRKSRTFTPVQRRSLRARDRLCRFPGCARTRHLHAHHTVAYPATRHTTIAEGALFCPYHHWLIHHLHYTVSFDHRAAVVITRPDGTVLRGAPRSPPTDVPVRGPDPPSDVRRIGAGQRLTPYARDVIVGAWQFADEHATTSRPRSSGAAD